MKTYLPLGIVVLLVAVGAGVFMLSRSNSRLQSQVDERRLAQEKRIADTDTSAVWPDAEPSARASASATGITTADRLARMRAEVAALEQKALVHAAADRAAIDEQTRQRDPERGMMKLENMQNVGQATPAAALQTLLWAALKGDDQAMTRIIGWDGSVRPRAQALIDQLPAETRQLYPTPEALTALLFSKHVLGVPAVHISKIDFKDAANASLTVKGLTSVDQHLPMRRGAGGWQLIAGEPMLQGLRDQLSGKKPRR